MPIKLTSEKECESVKELEKRIRDYKDLIWFGLVWFYGISTIVRGSLNRFPDFFRMGTFIESTLMKL